MTRTRSAPPCCFGLGYLYVGARGRFAATALVGPVFAVGACSASFAGVSYDYEQVGSGYDHDVHGANRASVQTGVILSLAVMLLAVDAARLAAARNTDAPETLIPEKSDLDG